MTDTTDRPSRRVLLQRVRNRLIDYLEVAASFDEHRRYQATAPTLHVPDEVVHQWQDWISEEWPTQLVEPVFSAEERSAIAQFDALWKDVTARLPQPLPGIDALCAQPEWQQLQQGAATLLQIFYRRGKLSEEQVDG
jgi:hypothetical protein